jgi:hypothetical protein
MAMKIVSYSTTQSRGYLVLNEIKITESEVRRGKM